MFFVSYTYSPSNSTGLTSCLAFRYRPSREKLLLSCLIFNLSSPSPSLQSPALQLLFLSPLACPTLFPRYLSLIKSSALPALSCSLRASARAPHSSAFSSRLLLAVAYRHTYVAVAFFPLVFSAASTGFGCALSCFFSLNSVGKTSLYAILTFIPYKPIFSNTDVTACLTTTLLV